MDKKNLIKLITNWECEEFNVFPNMQFNETPTELNKTHTLHIEAK